jgi:hypothetical protein
MIISVFLLFKSAGNNTVMNIFVILQNLFIWNNYNKYFELEVACGYLCWLHSAGLAIFVMK